MRTTPLLASAALLFAAWPLAARLGTIPGAILSVTIAVLLALGASGGLSALAMAQGALGAFAAGLASPGASVLGGALLLAGAYAERTSRVHGKKARVLHVTLAGFAGAVAGGLTASFADATFGVRAVAIVVAAVSAFGSSPAGRKPRIPECLGPFSMRDGSEDRRGVAIE